MRWEYFPSKVEVADLKTDKGEEILSVLEATSGHYTQPKGRFSFVRSYFVDGTEEKIALRENGQSVKQAMLEIACKKIEENLRKQFSEILQAITAT